MEPALQDRLQVLNAEHTAGGTDPATAVWLACDLLVAGVETPAVIELAGESPTALHAQDAQPLVARMLTELNVEPLDELRANWIIARDIACRMISGDLPAEHGAGQLWGMYWDCEEADELQAMCAPVDEWGCSTREPDVIRADMRTLAQDVVRAAETRLT